MKISKELVSEVFKLNICEAYIENNILYFDMGLPLIQSINLYEFAFKCKEWIINKEYHINTSENRINNYIYLYKMIKSDFGYEIYELLKKEYLDSIKIMDAILKEE